MYHELIHYTFYCIFTIDSLCIVAEDVVGGEGLLGSRITETTFTGTAQHGDKPEIHIG